MRKLSSPWPYNLLKDLYGKKAKRINIEEIPDDLEDAIDYTLSTTTIRIADIIYKNYKENKSLESIAAEYSLSLERIRQIRCQGIQFLKHWSRFKYIKNGLKKQNEKDKEKEERRQHQCEDEEKLAAVLSGVGTDSIIQLIRNKHGSDDISCLDLSNRAYCLLRRNSFNTIGHICEIYQEGLLNIKGCGLIISNEIVGKLVKLGLNDIHDNQATGISIVNTCTE